MKIVITGANGFVGKNLSAELSSNEDYEVIKITRQSSIEEIKESMQTADFVFHLAGVNRPETEDEFQTGNVDTLRSMLDALADNDKKPSIVFSSTIQAALDNPYGRSKRAAEEVLEAFGKENGNEILIYRLPNLFGKWSRPNYNTVIATF